MDGETGLIAPAVVEAPALSAVKVLRPCGDSTEAWTPERVERLKKEWAAGTSAGRISVILGGVSRNAVIGKVHRLGLARRATTSRNLCYRTKRAQFAHINNKCESLKRMFAARGIPKSGLLAAKSLAIRGLSSLDPLPLPERQASDIGRKSIVDVEAGECRFPVTQDDGKHLCCADKAVAGLPYCAAHARRCYSAAAPQEPAKIGLRELRILEPA